MRESKLNNQLDHETNVVDEGPFFRIEDIFDKAITGILSESFSNYVEERNTGVLAKSPNDANLKFLFVKRLRDEILPNKYNGVLQREKKILSLINKIPPLSHYKKQKTITIKAVEHLLKTIPATAWEISQDFLKNDYVSRINTIERIFRSDSIVGNLLPAVFANIYLSGDRSSKVFFNTLLSSQSLTPGLLTSKIIGSNENVVSSVLCLAVMVVTVSSCFSLLGLNYDDPEPISSLLAEFIENEPELFDEIINTLNEKNIFSDLKDFHAFRVRLQNLNALPSFLKRPYITDLNAHHEDKERILFGGFSDTAATKDEELEKRNKINSINNKNNKSQQETIHRLKQDVARLTNELKNSKPEANQNSCKSDPLQNENRELKNQIQRLNEELAVHRKEILSLKDFTQLILNSENENELETQAAEGPKVFISDIQKHVAFVGGHENLHMKLRKSFPKALYLNPDKLNFTNDAFENIKYCLYFTEYCNHSLFEKVSVEIKKRGIKSTFCPYNNVDKVFDSLNTLVQFKLN
ncbi:MAG: hypothetical protein ACTS9Y_01040 [Methylophilus sp.]|uniref:hypothetical protein n=1 Tax=Methylophilus sp. TaxID=29541 RepID=UPI003FA046ED